MINNLRSRVRKMEMRSVGAFKALLVYKNENENNYRLDTGETLTDEELIEAEKEYDLILRFEWV